MIKILNLMIVIWLIFEIYLFKLMCIMYKNVYILKYSFNGNVFYEWVCVLFYFKGIFLVWF